MTYFDFIGYPGAEPESAIIDPADEHFEQSLDDFAEYDRAIGNNEYPIEELAEPNDDQFGDRGNPMSLQGFDLDTFRDRS